MTRLQHLTALRDKVKAGKATEYSIFREARLKSEWQALDGDKRFNAWEAYNGSLDAAKALHEALLPGWDWLLNSRSNYAHVWEREDVGDADAEAQSVHSPSRAWLLAIIEALRAQEGGE